MIILCLIAGLTTQTADTAVGANAPARVDAVWPVPSQAEPLPGVASDTAAPELAATSAARVRRSDAADPATLSPRGLFDLRTAGALVAVLAVLLLLAWVARRVLPQTRLTGGKAIQVVGRTFLSSRQSVALVQVGERLLLIGITPEQITTLTTIDDPAEMARLVTAQSATTGFERTLHREAAAFEDSDADPKGSGADAVSLVRTRNSLRDLVRRVRDATAGERTPAGR